MNKDKNTQEQGNRDRHCGSNTSQCHHHLQAPAQQFLQRASTTPTFHTGRLSQFVPFLFSHIRPMIIIRQALWPKTTMFSIEFLPLIRVPRLSTEHISCTSNQKSLRISSIGFCMGLVGFVADQGNDHAVQVEEEHQEVETKLEERFLFPKY